MSNCCSTICWKECFLYWITFERAFHWQGKWKFLECLPDTKVHPWRELQRLMPPGRTWKMQGWCLPWLHLTPRRLGGCWRMTVDYLTLIGWSPPAAAIPDEYVCPNQLTHLPSSWYVAPPWLVHFSPHQFSRITGSSLPLPGRANSILPQFPQG